MQVLAQAVKIDAHPLVGLIVVSPVNHVRRRRPQRVAKLDLLATDTLSKTGRQEQMPQLRLRVVDGHRALVRWLVRLQRRNVVLERKSAPPLSKLLLR